MSGAPESAQSDSLFGTLYSWGGSMVSYASSSINSILGWDELEVVDPTSAAAAKGMESKEAGLNAEIRKQTWGTKQFQQYIGADVTSLLSVPVWIMEPFSTLQKMAEIMEYTQLLDKADMTNDEYERMAWVVAYCVSPYGASERAWKPFNPILGETFELQVGNGVKYLAEQVSHHPPIGAAHAENTHFTYDLVSAPTTRFLGNTLEVYPLGRTRIHLRGRNETFTHVPANATVHNIVVGRTWVDVSGDFSVVNVTSGAKCLLNFKPCGWFGYGRYEFEGYIYDKQDVKRMKVYGKWNSYVEAAPCDADGTVAPDVVPIRMWECAAKPESDYYGFTHFAHRLNGAKDLSNPLPSDCRRRPDRAALARGDYSLAGSEKTRLEEMQRAERRERESRSGTWKPRWFTQVVKPELYEGELEASKVPFWEFNGEYLKLPQAPPAVESEVDGKGFSPWQYPDIHPSVE